MRKPEGEHITEIGMPLANIRALFSLTARSLHDGLKKKFGTNSEEIRPFRLRYRFLLNNYANVSHGGKHAKALIELSRS